MPSIRDLLETLCTHDGVEGAILLGRDGLLIDSRAASGIDPESTSALVPALASAADELGAHSGHGGLTLGVVELERGYAVVAPVSADALLLVLARTDAQLATLLYELRRHRGQLATLV